MPTADELPAPTSNPGKTSPRWLIGWLSGWWIFGLWCALVVVGCLRHEFWRDEVRAFSIARNATSLVDLMALMKNEGHPALWQLLLRGGFVLTSSRLVLPITSLVIAAAAMALLIFRSPLPLWLTALFVFGRLGLYEYSVVARNYGISMLLMFGFAWLYPKRGQRALPMGLVLALLANTNLHSLLIAGALMAFWAWDALVTDRQTGRAALVIGVAAIIYLAGAAAALSTLWPTEVTSPTDATRYTAAQVVRALCSVLVDPAGQFGGIAPRIPALAIPVDLLFVAGTLMLLRRPAAFVTAWLVLLVLSVLFQVVYPGGYRHQGLLIVAWMTLFWIVRDQEGDRPPLGRTAARLSRIGLYAFSSMLLVSLLVGTYVWGRDVVRPQSASRAFGQFLTTHAEYREAILVGEPDFYLESTPYYAGNPIYIAREQRFGDTVSFTRRSALHLGLGQLMRLAWQAHERQHRAVLIAVGHHDGIDPTAWSSGNGNGNAGATSGSVHYGYDRTFSWSGDDLRVWRSSTKPVARFVDGVIGDERFSVYELVAPPDQGTR